MLPVKEKKEIKYFSYGLVPVSLFLFLFPSLLSLLYILLKLKPCYSDTFNCETNETVAKRNQYSQGNQDNMEEYNQESAS